MSKKPKQRLTLSFLFDKSMFGEEKDMYIYVDSPKTLKAFITNAMNEGFTFKDGSALDSKFGAMFYRIFPDKTVDFPPLTLHYRRNIIELPIIQRINYARYLKGKICCNESGQKLRNYQITSNIPFIVVNCQNNTTEEKQNFYGWLLERGYLSWATKFVDFNNLCVGIQERHFYFEAKNNYSTKQITIDEFKTIHNILYKEEGELKK